ncbi:MAG TPA: response regulator [Anaeromyxobacter sp.]|nr:response regulator [Anaeromyxobacter sp.]
MASPTVMVVEDEAAIREVISLILSYEGYEIQTAVNGDDALAQLRRGGALPDLILLDITMPVMDGIAFRLTQLRDPELCEIPVVVASALVPVQELSSTRQLQKPFRIQELLDAVTQALGHARGLARATA